MFPGRRLLSAYISLALIFVAIFGAGAQEKKIHLRNETILTGAPAPNGPKVQTPASAQSLSGLYLVQFSGRFDPAWQGLLRARGVQLIRYIPDDAFVVRADNARAEQIRALPFVHWVGPYRPEHKVHTKLTRTTSNEKVRILFSPKSTAREIALAKRSLSAIDHETTSRFGTIAQGIVSPAQLKKLAQDTSVLWVEPAPKFKLGDEIASKIVGGDTGFPGTPTVTQQLGFDGSGVIVAVADSGYTGELLRTCIWI